MGIVESQAGDRALRPGGGRRIRLIYLLWTVSSAGLMVGVIALLGFAVDGTGLTRWCGSAVALLASALAAVASVRGVTAVHGDRAAIRPARQSGQIARAGSLVGWFGAPVILLLGVGQWYFQDVDMAALLGLIFAMTALLPGSINDAIRRLSATLTWTAE